ncbi:MAG: hypothetical protein GYA34_17250, partial [Chloroflexi bacterium]|nr:hypothetical protein [Chloroflexota bacterium]
MDIWQSQLIYDPLPRLLSSGNKPICYYTRLDLLGEQTGDVQQLWVLPELQKILKKQLPDGYWTRSGENKHPAINIHLIETFRNFRFLVEQYGINRYHPQGEKAAEYLFSCQTDEGDFRGIL